MRQIQLSSIWYVGYNKKGKNWKERGLGIILFAMFLFAPILANAQASGGQIVRKKGNDKTRTSKSNRTSSNAANVAILGNGKTIVFETSQAVDLGLPSGTIWAGYNIGANSPKQSGGYYAWGDVDVKSTYTKEHYFDTDRIEKAIVKFKEYKNETKASIIGTDRDVAQVKWGKPWKMPSKAQIEELISKCKKFFVKCNDDSKEYILFKGPNGKSILFLASGKKQDKYVREDHYCYYWSGELDSTIAFSHMASCLFGSGYTWDSSVSAKVYNDFRWYGMNVRAVKSK